MVKNKILAFGVTLVLLAGLISLASASVGVGISPSKIILTIEGGQAQQMEFLMFNSGDAPIKVNVLVEGDIADFSSVSGVSSEGDIIQPEPQPHELPIKNGKTFSVAFNPPMVFWEKKYSGTISISGSPVEGSQFGGSVGVATQAEIIVTPSGTAKGIFYAAVALILVLAFLCLKKYGMSKKRRR